jgi:myo-inositol-1(or 4)-monophosphatase
MASPYPSARDAAVEAALRAASLIQHYAGRIRVEDVRDKGSHDLVTDIDERAQQLIVEVLDDHCPGFDVLAEESGAHVGAEHADGYRWIIDPIDGTTNFTRGIPPYAVSIALQHEAEIVVGVVLDVSRGELFTAVRGGGLFVNGAAARVSRTSTLEESVVTTGFPFRSLDYVDEYLAVMRGFMERSHGVRRPGSAAVDLAYVAAGRFDAFFELDLMPWDMAAGMLLVEEAGGTVSDFAGKPFPLFRRQTIASNGMLHEAMLAVCEPMRKARVFLAPTP